MHSANDGIYIPVRATEHVASINCTGLVAVRRVLEASYVEIQKVSYVKRHMKQSTVNMVNAWS